LRPVVVALGNFDGVHLGHQVVLSRAVEEARRLGGMVVAATFWPHPRSVIGVGASPGLLTTIEARREALLAHGADEVRTVPFDRELSRKSPEEFVGDVLVGELGARAVVVGENFRFGYKAAGDFEELGRLMRRFGGEAYAVEVRGLVGEISSTRIRSLLLEGDVAEAAGLLGRPYGVRGEVVVGDRRGRTIGFPTANVEVPSAMCLPADGVYAGWYERPAGETRPCAINVGRRPTFYEHAEHSLLEAHLIDFDDDLYGERARVRFAHFLRSERKFDGIDALAEQLKRDVDHARTLLA